MKKLLVVLLAAMMVLSLAAVSMAAATVGGELKLIYFTNDDDSDTDEEKWQDKAEAKITAETKVSDSVTGFVAFKAVDAGQGVNADEYHITIAQDYGTFKFGYFGHKLTPSLDIIKGWGTKEFKANALAEAKFNIAEGFTLGLAYALDGDGAAWEDVDGDPATDDELVGGVGDIKPVYDGAYDVSLGYATDLFGGEVHIFGNGDCVNEYSDLESATALDVWYKPIDMLKVYLAYVAVEGYKETSETEVDPATIIGVYADFTEAIYGRFEYNTEKYTDDLDNEYNNYGIKLGYKFTNGITAELKAEKTSKDSTYKELSMKVAL